MEFIHLIHGRKDGNLWHTINDYVLPRIVVWAGTVAAFNLFNACTIRHPPVALRTQKVGELLGDVDPLTWPAAKRSANLSIASSCPQSSGQCFMTQYFEPGLSSISCQLFLPLGNSHGRDSENTSLNRLNPYIKDLLQTNSKSETCISQSESSHWGYFRPSMSCWEPIRSRQMLLPTGCQSHTRPPSRVHRSTWRCQYADLARTVSVLALTIEWSPKLTLEARFDHLTRH